MQIIKQYIASDGTAFDMPEQCVRYEESRSNRSEISGVRHVSIDINEYDKLLMFMAYSDQDVATIGAWCRERNITFPGASEFPAVFVIECRHRASTPIDPETLTHGMTSGKMETFEAHIGRKTHEMAVMTEGLFNDENE